MEKSVKGHSDYIFEFLEEVLNFDSILTSFKSHLESKEDFSSGLSELVHKDDRLESMLVNCMDSIETQYEVLKVIDVQKIKLRSKDALVKLEGIFEKRSSFYFPTLEEQKEKFDFEWGGAREFFRLELKKRLALLKRELAYVDEIIDGLMKIQILNDSEKEEKHLPEHFNMQKWQAVLYGWFMCKIGKWKFSSSAELQRHLKNFTYLDKNEIKRQINQASITFSRLKDDNKDNDVWFEEQKDWFKEKRTDLNNKELEVLQQLKLPFSRGLDLKNNYYF